MDSKGKTIAILQLPNGKIITRENLCLSGSLKVKIFGIEYDSWHAEVRCILTLMKNSYFLNLVRQEKWLGLTVLRYNRKGKLAPNSKPCSACWKVLKIFKKRYLGLDNKFELTYIKDGKIEKTSL